MKRTAIRTLAGVCGFVTLFSCGGVYATWQYATERAGENNSALDVQFTFSPPSFSQDQQEAVGNFLDALNDPASNAALQEVLDSYADSWFFSRDYVNGNDIGNYYDEWEQFPALKTLAETGGYFIIKTDASEATNTSFVMFSTAEAVSGYTNTQMVQEVFKTRFYMGEDGKYHEEKTMQGEAPYLYDIVTGTASYNTDLWAWNILTDVEYEANLNTNVDNDPSTPVEYTKGDNAMGNFVHFAFTAETAGTYTVTTTKACKIGVYTNLADGAKGENLEGTAYKAAGTADATATSLTFTATANTKYYIRLTMPAPADGNYTDYKEDYIVQMSVRAD